MAATTLLAAFLVVEGGKMKQYVSKCEIPGLHGDEDSKS
jgi:hypothetical protein